MTTPVLCNLCGAADDRLLWDRPESGDGLESAAARMTTDAYGAFGRVVRCRRCGLVYRNPRPPSGAVLDAYAGMQDDEYLLEQECRSINAHLAMQVVKRHARGGRLLDLGCSTGYLLNAARLAFEVHGVEPSRWAVKQARDIGLDVVEGSVDSMPFPDGHFDVVTMVDVIEHLADPVAALARAARALKPGGLLYLVTPDIESLSARLLGPHWWGLRPAHLYYFSRKTMAEALRRAGFRVTESRSYGRIFTYGYWLSRIRNHPAIVYRTARAVIDGLGVREKVVYINTRDSMEICAVRAG